MSRSVWLALALACSARSVAPPAVATVAPTLPPGATLPPAAPKRFAERVLIISEDGLRPDALDEARTPAHAELMRKGARSLAARTIRQASTLPSHASMLSGVSQGHHGLFWNSWQPSRGYIKVPSIFSVAQAHGLRTAMFVGKRKLEHITPPGTVDTFERPGYLCKRVARQAARYFAERRPDLMFVHFSDPDEYGHKDGWMTSPYERGVMESDKCLGMLVGALRTAGLLDSTLVIVSSDHGGERRNHSGRKAVDRLIPWIAVGPRVKRGYEIGGPVSTMDTAATALYALGLPIANAIEGRPVREIFLP